MELLDLPDNMLEQIFEFLTYDEIAKIRLVSQRVNGICQRLLNIGFNKMLRRHSLNMRNIKSQLPRRESERRIHPLSKHSDILTCIETRISMLSMTYTKYIDLGICCFIPGKIIDEVMSILKTVETTTTRPLRAHDVLQELRDISSMAIDHFDEQIAPTLKKSFSDLTNQKYAGIYQFMQSPKELATLHPDASVELLSPQIRDSENGSNEEHTNRMLIVRLDRRCESIMKCIQQVVALQKRQSRLIRNNTLQISAMKVQMTKFKRRLDEITGTTSTQPLFPEESVDIGEPLDVGEPLESHETLQRCEQTGEPICISSASNSSTDSIEVYDSSCTLSSRLAAASNSALADVSFNATETADDPETPVASNQLRPNATNTILKRHIAEATEMCHTVMSKIPRIN